MILLFNLIRSSSVLLKLAEQVQPAVKFLSPLGYIIRGEAEEHDNTQKGDSVAR